MSVNSELIIQILSKMEGMMSQVRHLLSCPEGVRITAIWREDFSYVEYWDSEMPPRILFYADEKVPEEMLHQYVLEAIGSIPPSYCGTKPVEICTDIKTFSEGINVAVNVFEIKINEVTQQLIKQIRERNDFNNYLSRVREAQARAKQSSDVRGDN